MSAPLLMRRYARALMQTKDLPLNIRSQLLTSDSLPKRRSSTLNRWAMLRRNTLSLLPHARSASRHTNGTCERRRPAYSLQSTVKRCHE